MRLFEENKRLCYGVLAAVVVLLVLWPSFREGRPAVISFFKSDYTQLESSERDNSKDIAKYYDPANPKLLGEVARAQQFNDELSRQYDDLRSYVLFVPPMPFKIPAWEPQPGLKFLEIQTKAHTVELARYASLRDVEIADPFFGLDKNGVPPGKEKLPLLMHQLAMMDDLVRKAIDNRVQKIGKVYPLDPPVKVGPLNKTTFLKLYPVHVEVTASFEAIIAFVNSLDGFHGKVTRAGTQSRKEGRQVINDTIVDINLGTKHGLTTDREIDFTIFDPTPDKEDGLRYKGRAKVTDVQPDKCTAIVTSQSLPPVEEKEMEKRKIIVGDHASTNFYTLIDLRIDAVPGDKNSLTNRITAVITLAGVGLSEDVKGPVAGGPPGQKQMRPLNIRRGGY